MQRFFGKVIEGYGELQEEDIHHLLRAVRIEKGEHIQIVDDGKIHDCLVESLNPLKIKSLGLIEENHEPDVKIFLAFSLLKGEHNDLVVEKATEIGASMFLPFISERSIVRLDDSGKRKRLERFHKIARSAAAQSKRDIIPEIKDIKDYKSILNEDADVRLFAYEMEAQNGPRIDQVVGQESKGKRILILIGPEGGFSKKEAELAIGKGFLPVSLGKTILRGETASIVASSQIEAAAGGRK